MPRESQTRSSLNSATERDPALCVLLWYEQYLLVGLKVLNQTVLSFVVADYLIFLVLIPVKKAVMNILFEY